MAYRIFQWLFVVALGIVCLLQSVESKKIRIRNQRGEKLGSVRGRVLRSYLDNSFYAFRGIPYAVPPLAELRWKDPIPYPPWRGTIDGTEDPPMCPQNTFNRSFTESEDCLHLNVYTHSLPKLRHSTSRRLRPVIVYFHPGAWLFGSGTYDNHVGAEYLMDRDVVFVTLNYRLGALGFLATGTADCPGNFAMKDQVMALRWVRDHIASFGGDPDSVTIFGESVGGVSVILHMVSPMSRGLFHRVISMSAVLNFAQAAVYDRYSLAQRQARLFNCNDDDPTELVECLRKADAKQLAGSSLYLYEYAASCPSELYTPVIERDFGQERFLIEDPLQSLRLGKFARVPVIIGIVENELVYSIPPIVENPVYLKQINHNFSGIAPYCLLYDPDTPQADIASNEFRKTLPYVLANDRPTITGLGRLFSDGSIGWPTQVAVQLSCDYVPVYYYEVTYVGRTTYTITPYDSDYYRPVHMDDLFYLVTYKTVGPPYKRRDRERLMIERLTRFWEQFAYTGDPNRRRDPYLREVVWRRSSAKRLEYLEIGERMEMKRNLNSDRYELWDRLFPLPPIQWNTLADC